MKNTATTLFALVILFGYAQVKQNDKQDEPLVETIDKINNNDSTIVWHTFEKGVALAAVSERKIFVDVYTDWCGWCKKMDATTFKDERVVRTMNGNYIAVKLNAEQTDTIRFNTTDYVFVNAGRRGYHQFAAVLLDGQMSYPSFAILDNKGNQIKKIVGYQSSEQLITALSFTE